MSYRPKVLIIDDNHQIGFSICELSTVSEFDFRYIDNPVEGVAIFKEGGFDIVTTDIRMPQMSGFEVIKECCLYDPLVPVVAFTGFTEGDAELQCLEAGASYFLKKPFKMSSLLAVLRALYNRSGHINKQRKELKNLQELIREKETFYHASQNNAHPVVITDLRGNITYSNPAFTKLYGFSAEEILGKNPRIINPGKEAYHDMGINEQQYNKMFENMWASLSNPQIGHWEGEIPNITREGKIIWVQLIINAIKDHDGNLLGYMGMPFDISQKRQMEHKIRLENYEALSKLAEQRDNETGAHQNRIGKYMYMLARELNLPSKLTQDLEVFSQLHDIGKVGIADSILLAERRLSPEEFEVIKSHTTIGHSILAGIPQFEVAADIVRSHHERWDGKGYPDGLEGENIPLSARMTAICDVYDALRSKRPYKEPWPHEKAANAIYNGSGKHFDPEMVEAFKTTEKEFDNTFNTLAD